MDVGEQKDNFILLEMFTKDKDSAEFALKGFYLIKMDPSKEVTIVGAAHPGQRTQLQHHDQRDLRV